MKYGGALLSTDRATAALLGLCKPENFGALETLYWRGSMVTLSTVRYLLSLRFGGLFLLLLVGFRLTSGPQPSSPVTKRWSQTWVWECVHSWRSLLGLVPFRISCFLDYFGYMVTEAIAQQRLLHI